MPLPSKNSVLFAVTAILALGAAEAINLRLGHASILQNPGKGSLDLPPWLEGEKEREWAERKQSQGKKPKCDT